MPQFITESRNFVSNREDRLSPGSLTTGGQLRQLREARAAADPRSDVHMDKNIGAAVSSGVSQQFAENQKAFGQYVKSKSGEISNASSNLSGEYDKAYSQLVASKSAAEKQLGSTKSLEDEYRKWASNTTRFAMMTGDNPNKPGKVEGYIDIPTPYAVPFATALAKNTYRVESGKIYLHGRGAEVYDAYNDTLKKAKSDFYSAQAKPIQQYNSQVATAKSSLDSQFAQAMANLNVQKGTAAGQISAAQQGLSMEQQQNTETLAQIRESYSNRLSRITEALSGSVIRTEKSQSEKAPVKQIDSRMSTAR